MQVNYTIIGPPKGQSTALFNEAAGDSLEKVSGAFTGVLQREQLIGSSWARFARGNIAGKTTFKWTSTYASADAAQAAIATTNALKLTPMHLAITEGGTNQYLPNATAEQYEYDRQGSSVTHTLLFESDDLTNLPP